MVTLTLSRADQADEAIAQILALTEHERDQREDDDRAGERLEHGSGAFAQPIDRATRGSTTRTGCARRTSASVVVELLGHAIHVRVNWRKAASLPGRSSATLRRIDEV